MSGKRIWKGVDGSINVYVGKDLKAKKAAIAIAEHHGYKAVDLVDQIAIEASKKSQLVEKLNKELKDSGLQVVANIVVSDTLKDYLSEYANMSDSQELKDYLGKMEEQAEDLQDANKATHDLKDCVEDAEDKTIAGFSDAQLDFLKNLPYLDGYELKDLKAGYTDLEVLLDPDDLEAYQKLDKSEATQIQQDQIEFVRSKMGSGLLKHAMFSDEFTEKRKVAELNQALLGALRSSGLGLSDFAMWAASDEAGILADELYPEIARIQLKDASKLGSQARKLFESSIIDFIKHIDRNEYQRGHDMWEEKLGEPKSSPKSAPLIKKLKHLFKAG